MFVAFVMHFLFKSIRIVTNMEDENARLIAENTILTIKLQHASRQLAHSQSYIRFLQLQLRSHPSHERHDSINSQPHQLDNTLKPINIHQRVNTQETSVLTLPISLNKTERLDTTYSEPLQKENRHSHQNCQRQSQMIRRASRPKKQLATLTNFCCVSGWSKDFTKRAKSSKLTPKLIFSLDTKPTYLKQLSEFVFLQPVRFIIRNRQFVCRHAEAILQQGRVIPFMFVLLSEHSTKPHNQLRKEFPSTLLQANPSLHHYVFCMGFTDIFWVEELGSFIEIERVYTIITYWNLPKVFFQIITRIISQYRLDKLRNLHDLMVFSPAYELQCLARIVQQQVKRVKPSTLSTLDNILLNVDPLPNLGSMLVQLLKEQSLILPQQSLRTTSTFIMLIQALSPLVFLHPVSLRTPQFMYYLKDIPTCAIAVIEKQCNLQLSAAGQEIDRRCGGGSRMQWVLEARGIIRQLIEGARGQRRLFPPMNSLVLEFKESQLYLYFEQCNE